MSQVQTDRAGDEQRWLSDMAALKARWVWWVILLMNMVLFAWGLRGVERDSIVPLSCVWLGAFSCCTIFHLESIKRTLALRAEVEELRRALEERGILKSAPRSEID